MPAALPLIAGAFLAAGSIATAIGLGTAIVVAGLTITWAAALTITGVALMAVAFLARKTPKPDSSGQQLNQKLDPQAPIPIVYGRTASGGFITSRNTFGKKNSLYGIVTVLSVGAIAGIESYQAGDYAIGFNRDPAVQTATAVTVGGYGGSSKLYKGKLFQRWVNGQIPATLTPASASGYPITGGVMSAVAYVATVYEYNTDAFPQGLPVSMWVLRGQRVYDPRKDSTYPGGSGSHRRDINTTWEYSDNPYLCALNWTLGRYENGKRLFGIGAKWEEVDVASFVAGANIAAANNWRVGGQVVSTDDKYAVLTSILAAGSGSPIARGAQIACSVNAPKVATLTLGREDIIGEVEIQSSTSLRDRQNTIVPRYREESQQWEIISGERISAPIYVEEDRGQAKTVEIEMPLVQQAAQAHQLAAYELVNSREFLTFTVKTKLRMLAARVGDAITVNVSEISANSKKCVVIGREFNPSDATVTLSLKSETDGKHAFALGQSQVAPPSAKLDGYDPSNPGAPEETAWSITDTKITNGTNTIPAIVVSGAVDDPYAVTVIAEYRPLGSSVWLGWGEHPRDTKRIEITAVTDKTAYEVALSYRSNRGVVGDRLILSTTAGSLVVNYGNVSGTPTKIRDVNEAEGIKFDGIEPNATNGSTIGVNVKNPDGSIFVPSTQEDIAAETAKLEKEIKDARDFIDQEIADRKLSDGQFTTQVTEISVRGDGGGNLLSNTDFPSDNVDGWGAEPYILAGTAIRNVAGNNWHPVGENVLGVEQIGHVGRADGYIDWVSGYVPVRGGAFIQYYAECASHRCNTQVWINVYDQAGVYISSLGGVTPEAKTGGKFPNNWARGGVVAQQLPVGAASVRLVLRKLDTFAGEPHSYAWFWRPYVGFARQGQTGWNEYSPGSSKASTEGTTARFNETTRLLTNATNAVADRSTELEAQMAGNKGSGLNTAIGNVRTIATTAASDLLAVAGRTDRVEAQLSGSGESGLKTRIASVETIADAAARDAGSSASQVNTLTAKIGDANSGLTAQVNTASSVAATVVDKQARANWAVTASTPSGVASIALTSSTNGGGAVEIVGDVTFRGKLAIGQYVTGPHTEITDSYTVYVGQQIMSVHGVAFGNNNQFMEWVGPVKSSLAQCTEAEAVRYVKTDGSAYFGGSLSSGILTNSGGTTLASADSYQLGPFTSAGKPVLATFNVGFNARLGTSAVYTGDQYAGNPAIPDPFTGSRQTWRQAISGSYIGGNGVVTAFSNLAQDFTSTSLWTRIGNSGGTEPQGRYQWVHSIGGTQTFTTTLTGMGSGDGRSITGTRNSLINVADGSNVRGTITGSTISLRTAES